MLTDYHVHLRPDAPGTTADQYFTPENAELYRETAQERGISELGVAEHIYRFTAALDVWQHPLWVENAQDDIDRYCDFVRDQTDLKLGIEADFIPGREDKMRSLLEQRDWDYVVGSIHFLAEGALDYDRFDVWNSARSADHVWKTYFTWLGELAATGMYDILAHPDLVKHWGSERPWPEKDLRFYYDLAMEQIAESGIAIELSTAGLRKPVGEMYPDRAFLEMVVDAGNPIALSSDAHTPEQLGFEYEEALALLDEVGVKEIAVFERRAVRLEPVG
ncbi:MAG: histidinol-phosphatase [Conexibacter sp.]|nr:histidinol-phosphatase [Conexibacter sp.]